MTVSEHITSHGGPDGDWECVCGNHAAADGFSPCQPGTGQPVEPVIGGPWDEKHNLCWRCGRIIDQDTLAVAGRISEAALARHALAGDAAAVAAAVTTEVAPPREFGPPLAGTAADKLRGLSARAAADATAASQRGDTEGSMYARGLRDAYATAAVLVAHPAGVTTEEGR